MKKYHHSRLGLLLKAWNPNSLHAAAPFPLNRIGMLPLWCLEACEDVRRHVGNHHVLLVSMAEMYQEP